MRRIERIRNEEIRQRTGNITTAVEKVKDIQRRWFGHVERMTDARLPKRAMYHREHGTRPVGRPRLSWLKSFKKANPEKSWRELTTTARSRRNWEEYRRHQRDPTRLIQPDGT